MAILGQTKGTASLVFHPQQHHKQVPRMRTGGCAWYILWILSQIQHISISKDFLIYVWFSTFINHFYLFLAQSYSTVLTLYQLILLEKKPQWKWKLYLRAIRRKENSEPNVDKASLPLMALTSHITWTQSLCTTCNVDMTRRANGARHAQDLTVWNAAEQ